MMGANAMQEFIARQNIANFKALLERERDPAQRNKLNLMVAEEQARLRALQATGKRDER
jgi:hypothetical protein